MKGWLGLCVAAMLMVQVSANAQHNGQIIATGDGFSFMVKVPAGWQNTSPDAQHQQLKMAMVPEGSSWTSAECVIYSNVTDLQDGERETVFDVVNFDLDMYRLSDGNLQVEDGESISVNKGRNTALVVKLHSPEKGTYEAVAYMPEYGRVPFVVLSANSKEAFDNNYAVFEQVVSSFRYTETASTVRRD